MGRLYGTTPVVEYLAWLDAEEAREPWNVFLRRDRAPALAMLGRFDEARGLLADARAELADRGARIQAAATAGQQCVDIELLAGDPAAAARIGEEGCRLLGELDERSFRSTAAGFLARAYYQLERLDDADVWAGRAAELGASDDALTQMLWREVRALVLARRGEYADAERLAREAVAIGEAIQAPSWQADSHADLGEVLSRAGRNDEAIGALDQALVRYERKGNLVMAQRTRARLSRLKAVATSPRA